MMRDSAPADLATLAWAAPGQELKIRCVLDDPDTIGALLHPGEVVRCRDITSAGPVFSTQQRGEIRMTWSRAERVQVERTGFHPCIPYWRREATLPSMQRRIYRGEPVLQKPSRVARAEHQEHVTRG